MALRIFLLFCLFFFARAQTGPDDPGGNPKAACINGADQVQTPSGFKRIDQLKTGNYVAVGKNKFEPISTFLHRDETKNAKGFQFTTTSGKNLTLSDEHIVFIAPNRKSMLAKNVKVGQAFYLATNSGYEEETILKKERSELKGRYSPLTPSGVILVNDILVSCYSQTDDHHLMHRIVNWLLQYTFSEKIFGADGSMPNRDGMHWVGDILWHHLRHWFIYSSS